MGCMGHAVVRTPNLDCLASEGSVFDSAYTSYPLCVPARMSFLTGQLPSRTGITTNQCTIPQDQITFMHSLAAAGYETVLDGRMHFVGVDQKHGFTERFVGDQTPTLWHRKEIDTDRGEYFTGNYGFRGCLRHVGHGNSPVLEYDREVTEKALKHYETDVSCPQCVVVGTYGPHFPYAAPRDLYEFYLAKVELPDGFGKDDPHPLHRQRDIHADPETARKAVAAYYGMVEHLDGQIGKVRDAFEAYCRRNGREGVFIYMSDHGDQNGEHNLYGKMTFYEGSARIPLIISGINAANSAVISAARRVECPVSIMDIGPTVCALAGMEPPAVQDGRSLLPQLSLDDIDSGRHVCSEIVEQYEDGDGKPRIVPGRMVRRGSWKLITYHGMEEYDMLFDLDSDPRETHNRKVDCPDTYTDLMAVAHKGWDPGLLAATHEMKSAHHRTLAEFWNKTSFDHGERWRPPSRIGKEFTPG
jgi:choline-sulfatase